MDWNEGLLRKDQRRFGKAEDLLTRAAALFRLAGESTDAAMVSLDLALVYATQGKTAELRQLAAEIRTIFSAEDVHREAIAALVFFEEAARQDQATIEVIEDVSASLERARPNPALRFRR